MNIPYFSIIKTPETLIVVCSILTFVGYAIYIEQCSYDQTTKFKLILRVIASIFLTLFLVWAMVGGFSQLV